MHESCDTYGWRGKIGFVSPARDWRGMPEVYPLLPEGVTMTITTLGMDKLVAEDANKTFEMYPDAARHLERQECDVVVLGGSVVFPFMGYERSQEMIRKIRESVKVPVINNLEAHFDALRALSAKKIVIATPYEDARNEERKKLCESVGFEVLNIKGLGLQRRADFGKQPPYASYRLAKQAFLEDPQADAIYISCPEWPTIRNIERLEQDTGKPVVAAFPAMIWAALRTIGIKEPVKGYGKLLELL